MLLFEYCYLQLYLSFDSASLFSDGITGSSLGARMLQGGVKKGLLLRNIQMQWAVMLQCGFCPRCEMDKYFTLHW